MYKAKALSYLKHKLLPCDDINFSISKKGVDLKPEKNMFDLSAGLFVYTFRLLIANLLCVITFTNYKISLKFMPQPQ